MQYDEITRLTEIITTMREPFNHHGRNVATLAMELASAAHLPASEVYLIGVGANLHDIGKLLIRADLLNAPRRFTKAERSEVEAHTTLGWQIVHELGTDTLVCDAVRYHHERWDGRGYPDGLMGTQIPIAARMIGICDVYAALTSERVHRKPFDHLVATAMIQKDKNTAYDPELVDLFFAKVAHG